MNIEDSLEKFNEDQMSYFLQWTFEEPITISKNENLNIKTLGRILNKLIKYFVNNYKKYELLFPIEEDVLEVLSLYEGKAYESIGTYRTDFVYDQAGRMKIIEISCRCSLNAMFMSSVFNKIASNYNDVYLKKETLNEYRNIYEHIEGYLQKCEKVYVLQGVDKRNESKIFSSILERTGKPVVKIEVKDIINHLEELENAWIITELSFNEIKSIPQEVLKKLIDFEIFNDLRTVFLIHDKRFFAVLRNEEFLNEALSKKEIALFQEFYIPTFSSHENEKAWKNAKKNKSNWIVKPNCLGNGDDVYAGELTNAEKWNHLIDSREEKKLVLQEWVGQNTIKGKIKEKHYNDYVTGTFLFFDDAYFGLGPFRTSSMKVANQIDHRKASSLIINE